MLNKVIEIAPKAGKLILGKYQKTQVFDWNAGIKRTGQFTVNFALIKNNQPVPEVIYGLELKKLYA